MRKEEKYAMISHVQNDGFFNQTSVIDHNASNDIIDSQLNSKDYDDNDDDD